MKRILLDQNLPRKLIQALVPNHVETAYRRGWSELRNSKLLEAAEAADFHVIITADQSFEFQQNLARYRLAVIILDTNRWPALEGKTEMITAAVAVATAGQLTKLSCY